MKATIAQEGKIVEGLAPAADAAGRSSAAVSLKNANGKVTIVAHITQGNAATVTITPLQATDVAKTGGKALSNPAKIWANLDTSTSDALVAQTDAVAFTTDAAVKNKIVVIEVDADNLDINNGFDCVYFTTGASNVANITQGTFVILDVKYQGASNPSLIAN